MTQRIPSITLVQDLSGTIIALEFSAFLYHRKVLHLGSYKVLPSLETDLALRMHIA